MLFKASTSQVLDAVTDASAWKQRLETLPSVTHDVYFQPEYVALHCFHEDAQAVMFTYERAGESWLYPFLFRQITRIGNNEISQPWSDIESAYGYSGPLSSSNDPDFLDEANEAFTRWCNAKGVIAEFVRFHPLLENQIWSSPEVKLVYDRETVSIDLQGVIDENQPFDRDSRYMLRRAQKTGSTVRVCAPEDCQGRFMTAYTREMERQEADEFYFFGDSYFGSLGALLPEAGWIMAAGVDSSWAAAAIFLKGPNWLHYHLAITDRGRSVPGAMNQVLFQAAQMGREQGLTRLHLGGGRTNDADDSLLSFKRSMATDSHSFHIGTRVHNEQAYGELCDEWRHQFPQLVPKYGNRLLCYRYGS